MANGVVKEEQDIEEASVTGNIKGFAAPFGSTPTKRKRGRPKRNPSKPFGEAAMFENQVALALLGEDEFGEVVRKRGDQWVMHDDDTDAALATFQNREDAWSKQRQHRAQRAAEKKSKSTEKQRQLRSLTPTIEKPRVKVKPKMAPKPKLAKKPTTEKDRQARAKARKVEVVLFKALKNLKEANMISYVFENAPESEQAVVWEKFVSRLSKETVMSDPKLKSILQKMAKSEAKLLAKAVSEIKQTLGATGSFQVEQKGSDQDATTGDIKVNFVVHLKEGDVSLSFAVKLENGRPLILFPDESRTALNTMGTQESKLLRAELMHVQETALNNMDDVVLVTAKRDSYLSKLEGKVDKTLNNMGPLEMAMLKYLVKNKYKGVR